MLSSHDVWVHSVFFQISQLKCLIIVISKKTFNLQSGLLKVHTISLVFAANRRKIDHFYSRFSLF